jgi:cytochrome c biogenesis protein CcdA
MVLETSVLVSAGAGLASFLSPCILPILPGFISYLSGTQYEILQLLLLLLMKRWETSKVIVMTVDEGSKSINNNSGPHQR